MEFKSLFEVSKCFLFCGSETGPVIAEVEMAGAAIGGADGGLLRADVVRPDESVGVLGSLGDKAAAGKEIDEGWKGGVYEFL
jgi:hypothetical protein